MIPGLASPAPQFGRTGLLPPNIGHVVLLNSLVFSGETISVAPMFYGAKDDLRFVRGRMRGDASRFVRSGPGQPGAFEPRCHLIHNGRIYLGGRLYDDGSNARAVLFSAAVSPNPAWKLLPTGIEGPKGSSGYRSIVGIAAKGSQLVALSSTGEYAVSDDGETWEGFADIGFTGDANALAGGDAGFLAVGTNGEAFTAADPKGAWISRVSTFSTSPILTALCVGNLFVIAGGARIATASGLANFTARSVPVGISLDKLMGVSGRLFAGGFDGAWLTSTDGATWSAPADTPFKGAAIRVRTGYKADGRWIVHWGNGAVSVSENDTSWTQIEGPKLPAQFFAATAFAV